jgi:hypothetical protein
VAVSLTGALPDTIAMARERSAGEQSPLERLRRSRAQIVELAMDLKGGPAHSPPAFPRSAIMRAATGRTGRTLLSGAAIAVTLMRPGLLRGAARLLPFAMPLLRGALNRYLVRRFTR